jgi:HlyD family secretion protein
MSSTSIKRILMLLAAIAASAVFTWLLWLQPLLVDEAAVRRGTMIIEVSEEGINRIRDTYVISAPLAGTFDRSRLNVGDRVVANKTVIATIRPLQPTMLDPRTRAELERAAESAKAAEDLAAAEVRRAASSVTFTNSILARQTSLEKGRVISLSALEKAQNEAQMAEETLAIAKAQLDLRKHDVEVAKARLMPVRTASGINQGDCCFELKSPIDGVVLKIIQDSETPVTSGMALVEIGDPRETEFAVELLSADAVNVTSGASARITQWGGEAIEARVRNVEPTAFTKVSALGIEEQRVRVLLDPVSPPEQRAALGHGFRVMVNITIWEKSDVLQLPISALIRSGNAWSVFKHENGAARLMTVEIGQMNAEFAEVISGLSEGDKVVIHPSDVLTDGRKIAVRPI